MANGYEGMKRKVEIEGREGGKAGEGGERRRGRREVGEEQEKRIERNGWRRWSKRMN